MRFSIWIPRTPLGLLASILVGITIAAVLWFGLFGAPSFNAPPGTEAYFRDEEALVITMIATLAGGSWIGTRLERRLLSSQARLPKWLKESMQVGGAPPLQPSWTSTIRICTKCGRRFREGIDICDACSSRSWRELSAAVVPAAVVPAGFPPTLVCVYTGAQEADALAAFRLESQGLAKHGYHPANQSWAQGQWGPGAWLVALPLCLVFIGFVLLAYMLIVKPAGTLTVTYTRIEAAAKPTPQPARVGPMPNMESVRERLARLDELHASGVVTDEEYAARRVKILDSL